jgi:hypothetical protein
MNQNLHRYKRIGKKVFNKYHSEILLSSNNSKVDPEIVFFIIVNEQVNRGDHLTKLFEKILVYLLPKLALKKDVSIGLGQIKISTAKALGEAGKIGKLLIKPSYNIKLLAQIIKKIELQLLSDCTVDNIVLMYTTGKTNHTKIPIGLKIYINIAKWSYSKNFFNVLQTKYNNLEP